MNITTGDTVTARWAPPSFFGETQTRGRRARLDESHNSATGRVVSIDGDRVTLDAGGKQPTVVERSWIVEVK